VVVGGGDPSLTRSGPHSLDALAQAVADAGITRIDGRLLVDDSRYDDQRSGVGWPSAWWASVGALSALVADRNSYLKTTDFLADPARTSGDVLRYGLTTRGIAVDGGVAHGSVDAGQRLARLDSPTINELVTLMLLRSDNLIAELLVKEIGHRVAHGPGTTAAGLEAINHLIDGLCVPNVGASVDGSGLSRNDHRSARELRTIIQAASATPWGMNLLVDLPLVGQPSALGGRLVGPRTTGNVRAKGGSLSNTRSLSAFLTTTRGRQAVLTILVNGGAVLDADGAIDDFVTAIASLPT
jgi:D-alanyl-D-alanine carboxypeptidase/D-alanyl-D-alanine-endopeptidase (penicillin-binding protein 4)